MFNYLRFRWDLWREQRARRRLEIGSKKYIKAARARGEPEEEVMRMELTAAKESSMHHEAVYRIHTSYLIEEAGRLIIPVPE
jgi:hypothetical protein